MTAIDQLSEAKAAFSIITEGIKKATASQGLGVKLAVELVTKIAEKKVSEIVEKKVSEALTTPVSTTETSVPSESVPVVEFPAPAPAPAMTTDNTLYMLSIYDVKSGSYIPSTGVYASRQSALDVLFNSFRKYEFGSSQWTVEFEDFWSSATHEQKMDRLLKIYGENNVSISPEWFAVHTPQSQMYISSEKIKH